MNVWLKNEAKKLKIFDDSIVIRIFLTFIAYEASNVACR